MLPGFPIHHVKASQNLTKVHKRLFSEVIHLLSIRVSLQPVKNHFRNSHTRIILQKTDSLKLCTSRMVSTSNSAFSHILSQGSENRSRLKIDLLQSKVSCTSTAFQRHLFWEKDVKGGYASKEKISRKTMIQEGMKQLREEISLWKQEVKEKFEDDSIIVRPGDMDKVWVFDKKEALDKWIVTCDSTHAEGFSTASLETSPAGHAVFSGTLSTRVPKDGKIKKAGYCNMRSLQPRKSFKREVYLDWSLYSHIELKVRGDGRNYLINISTSGYFDVTWNDMYSYVLYTRGGPYWQTSRIPFSKFFLSSKGRVQDKQFPIPLSRVVTLGISAGDGIDAPFQLEIDYIGLYCDPIHMERFAYEMYRVPRFMVGD
ncbi:complex I intermediate-associated protein 30 [Oratosquilla oratoria]|uniref:complex I intermediate-associated protein 30 n=1 Tax=Oratosquilla oratoria TaxID=337810 RepID=UPI003F75C4C2